MSNGNNMNNNNNLFSDLSSTDLLFINILNTIYNDNLRIINQLLDQNREITHNLINFMNNRRTPSFSTIFNDNLNQQNNNVHNTNINPNDRRIFIDNIPYYIVDEVQFFTIPVANNNNPNTNINVNNNNASLNENQRRRSRTSRNRFSHRYNHDIHNTHDTPFNWETNEASRIGRGFGFLNSFLQPVTIRPTLVQIENATSNLIYGDIVEPINTSCPISLETFTETSEVIMIKHCKHIFNKQSLLSWFNSNCKCPVCRFDIRDYVDPENNVSVENENIDEHHNNTTTNNNSTINAQETIRNIRNLTDQTSSILESIFQETLYDLSNNRIQFPFR